MLRCMHYAEAYYPCLSIAKSSHCMEDVLLP